MNPDAPDRATALAAGCTWTEPLRAACNPTGRQARTISKARGRGEGLVAVGDVALRTHAMLEIMGRIALPWR